MGWITYPLSNFNSTAVEVWEWISNFIPHFTGHVISYPCRNLSESMLVKGVPGYKEYACVDELYECIVQQKLLIFTCAISLIAEQKEIDVMEKHTRKHQQKSYSTIGLVCRHRKLLKWKHCNKHILVYIFLAPMFLYIKLYLPCHQGSFRYSK